MLIVEDQPTNHKALTGRRTSVSQQRLEETPRIERDETTPTQNK